MPCIFLSYLEEEKILNKKEKTNQVQPKQFKLDNSLESKKEAKSGPQVDSK